MTRCAIIASLLTVCTVAPLRALEPRPDESKATGIDADWMAPLVAIDSRVASINDLTASYEEHKHTALLKKPLISTGRLTLLGERARWDTVTPHRSTMLIGGDEIRIFDPERNTLEVYRIEQRLQWLALSPLPRLDVIREHFSIAPLNAPDIDPAFSEPSYIALRLTPSDAALRDHVAHIDVILDARVGWVVRSEMHDPDGDRTVLSFSNIKINTGVNPRDVELKLPDSTTVVRPLESLEGSPPGPAEHP